MIKYRFIIVNNFIRINSKKDENYLCFKRTSFSLAVAYVLIYQTINCGSQPYDITD